MGAGEGRDGRREGWYVDCQKFGHWGWLQSVATGLTVRLRRRSLRWKFDGCTGAEGGVGRNPIGLSVAETTI